MAREKRHENRVVLVTGGTGGIGEAIVRRYAAEGARVGIVDLDPERGRALAAELTRRGSAVAFAAADVGDYGACERACNAIQAELGAIDTLVNNAGISPKHDGRPHGIHEMDSEEWLRVVGVNLNTQQVVRVEILHEQWETLTVFRIDAEDVRAVVREEIGE